MIVTNAEPKILAMRLPDGTLPAHTFPGAYPLFYMDRLGEVLCPDCANQNDEFSEPLVESDANWEDPLLFCDHCSQRIESAYAD